MWVRTPHRGRMFDSRGWYLVARDIPDPHEYVEGKIKFYSKYLNPKTGDIAWVDQQTKQVVYTE